MKIKYTRIIDAASSELVSMQRTRVRSNATLQTEQWAISLDGGAALPFVRITPMFTTHSVMLDEIHGKVNRPDSPCDHRKITTTKPRYPDPPLVYTGAATHRFDIAAPDIPIGFDPSVVPELPSALRDEFTEFLHTAYASMQKQFEEKVSIANFVYELKDFSDTLKMAKKLFSGWGYGSSGTAGYFRRVASVVQERLSQGVGGNILDIELNWKSFVSDIPKIWGAYEAAMKRLEFLCGHARFYDHKRRRFLVDPYTLGFDRVKVVDLSSFGPNFGSYYVELVPTQMQVTFNACGYVDNHLQLEDINTWWALADTLGLNNSVKIAWNATKLSWVADMFVDTKAFLEAFEKEAYQGRLAVSGGNASMKVERDYDIVVTMPSDEDIPYVLKEEVVGGLRVRDYSRGPVSLVNPSLFSLQPELSTHQQVLLGSLLDAQLGLTSGGYDVISGYVRTFKRNQKTFGQSFWKRLSQVDKRRGPKRLG